MHEIDKLAGKQRFPDGDSRGMMLIVRRFQCEKTRYRENRPSRPAVQMHIMMLGAVIDSGAHRMLTQIENRVTFAGRRLDNDIASILANLDFLHPAEHASRNQDTSTAHQGFHYVAPNNFNGQGATQFSASQ